MRDERQHSTTTTERDSWKSIARTRNLKQVLDVPPPTLVQTLHQARILTVIQSLQVWRLQQEVTPNDTIVEGDGFQLVAQYLDIKRSEAQIILHRPHITLLFDSTTWNVGPELKTVSKAMQEGRHAILKTSTGSHFRLMHPDELVFQQPDAMDEIDAEIKEKMERLTTAPPVRLLNRTTSTNTSASPSASSPAPVMDVSRRLYEETEAALRHFKDSQRKALDRRLDRDGRQIELETDALMIYLGAYSASANYALTTLRRDS